MLDTQHEAALEKLRQLEDASRYQRKEEVEIDVKEAPKFVVPLNGPEQLVEGQSAHYECRIEPYPDSSLKLEWFHNNKLLQTGTFKNFRKCNIFRMDRNFWGWFCKNKIQGM